jgi:hypothetical protein
MRHHWQETGTREVPWQAAPITLRTCQRCGCVKVREPHGAHFRAVYELDGKTTNFAPECPGKEDGGMGPREVFKEVFKPNVGNVRKDLLPERFPYMPKGFVIDAIEVRAAGKLDDGREFQDVRVFTREEDGDAND